MGHAGLASLKNAGNLQELRLAHSAWEPLVWDDGIAHLLHVPNLRSVWTNAADQFEGSPLEKLAAERPDLYIVVGRQAHHQGEVQEHRDVDWDSVNTAVRWGGKNPGT